MKSIVFVLLSLLTGLAVSSYGQSLVVPRDIRLTTDSITKVQLINSLNGFLDQKEKPNRENTFVLKEDLLAMSALLDEFKGMDKNAKLKDDHFYKPYLTSAVDVGNNNFLIQLSYLGVDDSTPVLHASFRLFAKKQGDQFYFYSPLKQNTLTWKVKKMGNINFHFKDTLNIAEARAYLKTVNSYDKRLKVPITPEEFYFCDNFPEVLQISGVDYESNYQGIRFDDLTSHENNNTLEINGGYYGSQRFDRHDLWHDRLHIVMDRKTINRPVDEGCAYLYGGSWGTSWEEIVTMFKKYAADHPDADWLKLYVNDNKLRDDSKPILIPYAINALIVQKIEKEKGFTPVMELLSCGPRVTGDDNYFIALEKVGGISKADFNKVVGELVKAE
jgi:hypothetical protein